MVRTKKTLKTANVAGVRKLTAKQARLLYIIHEHPGISCIRIAKATGGDWDQASNIARKLRLHHTHNTVQALTDFGFVLPGHYHSHTPICPTTEGAQWLSLAGAAAARAADYYETTSLYPLHFLKKPR